jgi:hypothetical protein
MKDQTAPIYGRQRVFVQKKLAALFSFVLVGLSGLSGCGYRWGTTDRTLPGGYELVYVPVFKNLSMEPGVEVHFTNHLRLNFERSNLVKLTSQSQAEAFLEGEIRSTSYIPQSSSESPYQAGVVLVSSYEIRVVVLLTLRRATDRSIIWQSSFSGARTYSAPQVREAVINSVNPLYNLSARRQNIEAIAGALMAEAHDRISENF